MNKREAIIRMAFSKVGVKELEGNKSHPYVARLISTYIAGKYDDSQIAWCALMLMDFFDTLKINRGKANGLASTWLAVGKIRNNNLDARMGDVMVYRRGYWTQKMEKQLEMVLKKISEGKPIAFSEFKPLRCHVTVFTGRDYFNNYHHISGNYSNQVKTSKDKGVKLIAIINPFDDE